MAYRLSAALALLSLIKLFWLLVDDRYRSAVGLATSDIYARLVAMLMGIALLSLPVIVVYVGRPQTVGRWLAQPLPHRGRWFIPVAALLLALLSYLFLTPALRGFFSRAS